VCVCVCVCVYACVCVFVWRGERGLSFDGRMRVVRSCNRELERVEVVSFESDEESGGESGSVCVCVCVCMCTCVCICMWRGERGLSFDGRMRMVRYIFSTTLFSTLIRHNFNSL